jgi:hypothetical protein
MEKKWEYNGTVHQLFTAIYIFQESVRREVLCNIFSELGITWKLGGGGLITKYLNENYSTVHASKNLSDKIYTRSSYCSGMWVN